VQSAVPGSRPGLLRDCDLHPGGRRGPRRSGRSTEGPCQVERCFATTGVALPRSPVRTTIQVGVRREHHRVGACLDDQPVEWSTGLAFGGDSVDVASFDVVSLPPVLLGAPAPGPGYTPNRQGSHPSRRCCRMRGIGIGQTGSVGSGSGCRCSSRRYRGWGMCIRWCLLLGP
jgi:hypothetical protein